MTTQDRIVKLPEAITITGRSRSCIYRMMNQHDVMFDPRWPKPLKLGPKAIGWRMSEIQAWIESLEPATYQHEALQA